jgi:hypothetical protein
MGTALALRMALLPAFSQFDIVASYEIELHSLMERSLESYVKKQLALIHSVCTNTRENACKF